MDPTSNSPLILPGIWPFSSCPLITRHVDTHPRVHVQSILITLSLTDWVILPRGSRLPPIKINLFFFCFKPFRNLFGPGRSLIGWVFSDKLPCVSCVYQLYETGNARISGSHFRCCDSARINAQTTLTPYPDNGGVQTKRVLP